MDSWDTALALSKRPKILLFAFALIVFLSGAGFIFGMRIEAMHSQHRNAITNLINTASKQNTSNSPMITVKTLIRDDNARFWEFTFDPRCEQYGIYFEQALIPLETPWVEYGKMPPVPAKVDSTWSRLARIEVHEANHPHDNTPDTFLAGFSCHHPEMRRFDFLKDLRGKDLADELDRMTNHFRLISNDTRSDLEIGGILWNIYHNRSLTADMFSAITISDELELKNGQEQVLFMQYGIADTKTLRAIRIRIAPVTTELPDGFQQRSGAWEKEIAGTNHILSTGMDGELAGALLEQAQTEELFETTWKQPARTREELPYQHIAELPDKTALCLLATRTREDDYVLKEILVGPAGRKFVTAAELADAIKAGEFKEVQSFSLAKYIKDKPDADDTGTSTPGR